MDQPLALSLAKLPSDVRCLASWHVVGAKKERLAKSHALISATQQSVSYSYFVQYVITTGDATGHLQASSAAVFRREIMGLLEFFAPPQECSQYS